MSECGEIVYHKVVAVADTFSGTSGTADSLTVGNTPGGITHTFILLLHFHGC